MATIIDTLIVRLGLDSKDLTAKGGAADKTLKGVEGLRIWPTLAALFSGLLPRSSSRTPGALRPKA